MGGRGSILFLYASVLQYTVMFQAFILTSLFSFIVVGIAPNLNTLVPFISWIRWISIPRYAFVNHVVNEFESLPELIYQDTNFTKVKSEEMIEDLLLIEDFSYGTYWRNVGVMWLITVVTSLVTFLGLKWETRGI